MLADRLFNTFVFGKAETVLGVVHPGYHYRRTPGSTTVSYITDRPETTHHILEKFHELLDESPSEEIRASMAFYDAAVPLSLLKGHFFHPDNVFTRQERAEAIGRMKQMPHYHKGIYSRQRDSLTWKQSVWRFLLRQPFEWPLEFAFGLKTLLQRQRRS